MTTSSTKKLKHVLLRNSSLKGWEYGMLRELEDEIIRQTGAEVVEIPHYGENFFTRKAGHGMRLESLRTILPKQNLDIQADVLWCVLMGPENHVLDFFKNWNIHARYRVVYIYDTLPPQYRLMKKLFSGDEFNIRITSFADAIPDLEAQTGQQWHAVEQAVPLPLFEPVPIDKKIIHFSSYGRRFPDFHKVLSEFCSKNDLYYDFTTHDAKHPTAPEADLYRQYAWHLTHSLFTVSWPVELTNPQRAGNLHPITCRWFEAAASGTAIIGKQPGNAAFEQLLSADLVINIDPFAPPAKILKDLEELWSGREEFCRRAQAIAREHRERWSWKNRVERMLTLIEEKRTENITTPKLAN